MKNQIGFLHINDLGYQVIQFTQNMGCYQDQFTLLFFPDDLFF